MTTVLNIRDLGRVGVWPADVRRIDRRTPYGNPFRLEGDWILWAAVALGYRGDAEGRRAASVAFYRAWMTGKPGEPIAAQGLPVTEGADLEYSDGRVVSMDSHIRGIAAFAAGFAATSRPQLPEERPDLTPLVGARLACWCAPLPCHGDVLAELIAAGPGAYPWLFGMAA